MMFLDLASGELKTRQPKQMTQQRGFVCCQHELVSCRDIQKYPEKLNIKVWSET